MNRRRPPEPTHVAGTNKGEEMVIHKGREAGRARTTTGADIVRRAIRQASTPKNVNRSTRACRTCRRHAAWYRDENGIVGWVYSPAAAPFFAKDEARF